MHDSKVNHEKVVGYSPESALSSVDAGLMVYSEKIRNEVVGEVPASREEWEIFLEQSGVEMGNFRGEHIMSHWEFDAEGWVTVRGDLCFDKATLEELLPGIREVEGMMIFKKCNQLCSLKNFSKFSSSVFLVECDSLESLEGMESTEVKNTFDLISLPRLSSLEYSPKSENMRIAVKSCEKLSSLKGLPSRARLFKVSCCKNLRDMDGCPEYVKGDMLIQLCNGLVSLKGLPKEIDGFLGFMGTPDVDDFPEDCRVKGELVINQEHVKLGEVLKKREDLQVGICWCI